MSPDERARFQQSDDSNESLQHSVKPPPQIPKTTERHETKENKDMQENSEQLQNITTRDNGNEQKVSVTSGSDEH